MRAAVELTPPVGRAFENDVSRSADQPGSKATTATPSRRSVAKRSRAHPAPANISSAARTLLTGCLASTVRTASRIDRVIASGLREVRASTVTGVLGIKWYGTVIDGAAG